MDIIGSLLWLIGLTSSRARDIASRLREQAAQSTNEFFLRLNAGIKSFMVRRFLCLSFIFAVVEIAWIAVLDKFGGRYDRLWIYFLALTVLQIAFAFWNEFTGRVVGDEQGDATMAWGFMKRRVNRWLVAHQGTRSLYDYTKRSKPLVWYVLVPAVFMIQAVDSLIHALIVPSWASFIGESYGYTYHQRQWLMGIALVSFCIGCIFPIATGYFTKYTIRRGTRFIEWASTKTTQLALAIPPGIEYRDTLKELGGQIDIIDEDFVGSAADFFIALPITLLPIWVAVIFVPWYPITFASLMVMMYMAVTTFLYFRTGDAAHAEITADSRATRRLAFKLGLIGPVVITIVSFVVMLLWEDVLNAVYGVTFYAYRSWFIYLLCALGTVIAAPFLWKRHLKIKGNIKEGGAYNQIKELGSIGFMVSSAVTLLLFVGLAVCTVQDIRGQFQEVHSIASDLSCFFTSGCRVRDLPKDVRTTTSVRFEATQLPGSVSYMGKPTLKTDDGQTTLSFQTKHAARGILEFLNPQQALDAGMPPYLVFGPELDDTHDCGNVSNANVAMYRGFGMHAGRALGHEPSEALERIATGDESCDLYHHTVTFESSKYAGPYRIIMRNADERDTRLFGKVEVLRLATDKKDENRGRLGKDAQAALESLSAQPRSKPASRFASAPAKPCPTLLPIPGFD
ncbi:MAG: hypothetical protein WCW31_05060 [Patescibacteria group bacterium]|jgi:hypothetical protein